MKVTITIDDPTIIASVKSWAEHFGISVAAAAARLLTTGVRTRDHAKNYQATKRGKAALRRADRARRDRNADRYGVTRPSAERMRES